MKLCNGQILPHAFIKRLSVTLEYNETGFFMIRPSALICSIFTAPRGALKYKKNAVFRDPYFLIRQTPGITKIPTWKYSMCIQARNFYISDLCTEKWPQIGLKRGFFSTKVLMVFFCTNELQKTYIMLPFQIQ